MRTQPPHAALVVALLASVFAAKAVQRDNVLHVDPGSGMYSDDEGGDDGGDGEEEYSGSGSGFMPLFVTSQPFFSTSLPPAQPSSLSSAMVTSSERAYSEVAPLFPFAPPGPSPPPHYTADEIETEAQTPKPEMDVQTRQQTTVGSTSFDLQHHSTEEMVVAVNVGVQEFAPGIEKPEVDLETQVDMDVHAETEETNTYEKSSDEEKDLMRPEEDVEGVVDWEGEGEGEGEDDGQSRLQDLGEEVESEILVVARGKEQAEVGSSLAPKEELEDERVKGDVKEVVAGGEVRDGDEDVSAQKTTTQSLLERTEVLAAVVAGGVVGLLFAILLVLLLVHRVRKKDEGSYALGEAPPPAYGQAPNKEFYA
uniref:syndecan-1-like isoform X1 n=2 Tax=Myxine glutinosa TaxID=7769 RepID=UPI00358FFA60